MHSDFLNSRILFVCDCKSFIFMYIIRNLLTIKVLKIVASLLRIWTYRLAWNLSDQGTWLSVSDPIAESGLEA